MDEDIASTREDRLNALADAYGAAVSVVLAATLTGFVAERVAVWLLHTLYRERGYRSAEAVARALVGIPTMLGLLAGAWWAVLDAGLPPRSETYALKALLAVAIVVATVTAARAAGWTVRLYTEREDARVPSSTIFVNLVRGVVWTVGALSLLAALGISIAPMLAALGVVGLAVGLALQPTLENVFSGVQVLMSGQIKPGDFVQLESGQQGWVEDVTWRNTTLKLLSNDLVIVPNAVIGRSLITNYTSEDEQHVMWVPVGVSYASDLDEVERVTLEVAREVQASAEGASPDHAPLFRYTEFGESAIVLQVALRADSFPNRWPVRHEFIKRLHQRYGAVGIEIPLPQRVVHQAEAGSLPRRAPGAQPNR